MERIDGKALAGQVKAEAAKQAAALRAAGVIPQLTVILVGEDPASQVYVAGKARDCAECGIESRVLRLPAKTTQAQLLEKIAACNTDPAVNGLLVQLPLPGGIQAGAVVGAISPAKDVDGFTPQNMGRLALGQSCFLPCTPAGCIRLLQATGQPVAGRQAVVVGRSNIVGKPLALLLLQQDATVTVCHSKTRGLAEITRRADILVAAVGKKGFITAGMVKDGAVVLDVGINRGPDGKLYGDVDPQGLEQKPGYLTPVPGGVGLMTRAMLMLNTVKAARLQQAAAGQPL